jgi:hypothetical protein
MNKVTIWAVGGRCHDLPVGIAYDAMTALTLIEFLKLTGSTGCSLRGSFDDKTFDKFNGYHSLDDANNLFVGVG